MFDKIYENFRTYTDPHNNRSYPNNTTSNKMSGIIVIIILILFFLLFIAIAVISIVIWNKKLEAITELLKLAKCPPEMFQGNPDMMPSMNKI